MWIVPILLVVVRQSKICTPFWIILIVLLKFHNKSGPNFTVLGNNTFLKVLFITFSVDKSTPGFSDF